MLPFLYLCLSRSSKFSKSSTESFCNPYASTLLYFGSSFYYLIFVNSGTFLILSFQIWIYLSNDHFLSSIIHTHFQSSNLWLNTFLYHFLEHNNFILLRFLNLLFLMLQNIVGFLGSQE